ncbi:biliverdin-producing heme oxygenase [Flavobacterium silvaticum]|uniref:Biliverdin-producing heme oxygenase n=1 Tax=Flavobacterium silvaticum TaxID=1852020 RepID=A0A972FPE9_9FLAO|nr:biliverdin-producing heme oxygenase [Flavobacterium silvaticum]NMH26989.1 biliverdin-producing heme oxygenase [Flavobacterium silvaticum]
MNSTETMASAGQFFLQSLRSQTSDSHKKLDSLPASAVLMTAELTSEAYTRYLQLMYPVIKWAEEQAYSHLPQNIELPGQFKRHKLILKDLDFLRSKPIQTHFTGFETTSVAESFGVAYVIEGSSLGGVYIAKNVKSVLGYDENGGLSFLIGNGNTTGSNWKSFLNSLTGFAVENDSQGEIIKTATRTFEAIYHHLSGFAE